MRKLAFLEFNVIIVFSLPCWGLEGVTSGLIKLASGLMCSTKQAMETEFLLSAVVAKALETSCLPSPALPAQKHPELSWDERWILIQCGGFSGASEGHSGPMAPLARSPLLRCHFALLPLHFLAPLLEAAFLTIVMGFGHILTLVF